MPGLAKLAAYGTNFNTRAAWSALKKETTQEGKDTILGHLRAYDDSLKAKHQEWVDKGSPPRGTARKHFASEDYHNNGMSLAEAATKHNVKEDQLRKTLERFNKLRPGD